MCCRRNETVDEKSLIKKLRKRVAELETELSCLLMAKVNHSNNSENDNIKMVKVSLYNFPLFDT